jgi:serine/threonine-protein kinase PknG
MMHCERAGCGGEIQDGFCNQCGMAPRPTTASSTTPTVTPVPGGSQPGSAPGSARSSVTGGSGAASVPTPSTNQTRATGSRGTGRTGTARSTGRGNLGAGLVEVPPVPYRDPATVVLAHPEVSERKRFCSACGQPVGRGRDGQPGRAEGFCTKCRTRYSFTPKLAPNDMVHGQYEVVGCIAHGGLGWVYLARDAAVSGRWVVLKGLLDTGDESAMAAAIAERQFLAQVDHDNIVKIHNFVEHEGSGYIVMEYVGGQSLKELRQPATGPAVPLPLGQSIAYMLEVLPAFGYLHGQGLLYCDFKPDNVIQSEERVKLIDLGGVRRIDDDDSDLYGTVGYQAPEVAERGASVSSDLYTVARTLAVLTFDFRGFQDEKRFATSLPPRSDVGIFQTYESFYWFMTKATDPDPDRRFLSAGEMADQLTGVLREVIAIDGGRPPSAASTLFTRELQADPYQPQWRTLPLPTVDPLDPGATMLASLATAGADQLVPALQAAPPTPEISFSLVRAHLELGDLTEAAAVLDRVDVDDHDDWRSTWWRSISEMAAGRDAVAHDRLLVLARELPGELAPKLAMAVASERSAASRPKPADAESDRVRAGRYYELVLHTDGAYASAGFGLARVRLALDDRAAAADALRRIPSGSSSAAAAQIELCQVLSCRVNDRPPTLVDLTAASDTLASLETDPARRAALTRDVLVAALGLVDDGQVSPDPSTVVAGSPLVEADLRSAVERAYRTMAKLAESEAERIELIDEANRSRPRTLV